MAPGEMKRHGRQLSPVVASGRQTFCRLVARCRPAR
ncbi:hypothetical protein A2U01_0073779, partial [Trifolium medium]|nr:hypothetical protein [Trifolium medium]